MVRGKYRIDAFIASGSMANVYAATHRNGSRVALKILHKDLARDTSFGERFRREGYFGNAVLHPGIVRAIDDDMTDDGCAFLVFELLEGETLEAKRVRLGGKLTLQDALTIGDDVLDILAAAHDHQILHRDLKPDNVYLTRKGDVKLLDFGAARFNDGKSTSEMTAVGVVLGTPAFMAPEQAFGKREEVDARSDIWAVGAMLFTCLTGQGVHTGGDPKTKSIALARTPARSLKDVAAGIPRVVASVIDRALAFDKAERYADAKSMREALGWARRSLTGDLGGDEDDPINSEPETKRAAGPILEEEEPTVAGRSPLSEKEEEETEKRTKLSPKALNLLHRAPEIKRAPANHAPSEGVITSAPPVTKREQPPDMPMSEGPEFSLRNAITQAREIPSAPPERDRNAITQARDMPRPPASERPNRNAITQARETPSAPPDRPDRNAITQAREMPSAPPDRPMPGAPVTERMPGASDPPRRSAPLPDPGALFRAALERGLAKDAATLAAPVTALGPAPAPAPKPSTPRVIVEETPLPAPMPRAPVPLVFGPASYQPQPSPFGATSYAPVSSPLGPTGPPPALMEDPVAAAAFRVDSSGTGVHSVRPGPLLASVVDKPRGGGWRFLIPVVIGLAAAGATYALVLHQKNGHPKPPAPAPAVTPAALVVDAGAPIADASAPDAAPPAASSVPAVAASAPPPKKRKPKPKPPPATAPAEDPPAPAPAPSILE